MTTVNTISINDVLYVRADSITEPVKPTKKQIVVLQRGWVVIGDVEKSAEEIKISNASVVRVWGTTKGLGELAENGATSKTVLDKCPPVIAHPLSVVLFMNVNESKW